jgi:hypothetical protein
LSYMALNMGAQLGVRLIKNTRAVNISNTVLNLSAQSKLPEQPILRRGIAYLFWLFYAVKNHTPVTPRCGSEQQTGFQ